MNKSVFSDLGLSKAQIDVYLALLKLGETKVGHIIEKTGLQSSVVHNSVNSLIEQGLIKFVKKGKIRHYTASDPKAFLLFMDEKKKEIDTKKEKFEKIIPELIAKQHPIVKEEAEVFVGWKSFVLLMNDLIEDAKPGEEYLYFSINPLKSDLFTKGFVFYSEFERTRESKGLKIKGIALQKLKADYVRKKRNMKSIKFVDFPIPEGITIFRNTVVFHPWEDKVINFKIESKAMADTFREFHKSIWEG